MPVGHITGAAFASDIKQKHNADKAGSNLFAIRLIIEGLFFRAGSVGAIINPQVLLPSLIAF
jgi:hypothetical protein